MGFIYSYGAFGGGLVLALAAGVALWIHYGRRLNLYLVSGESPFTDQALIPVTSENGKRSPSESIDLTLTDFEGKSHLIKIGYGNFVRFFILNGPGNHASRLNQRALENDKRYPIRSGMKLSVGGREYTLHVARANAHSELLRRFG